MQLPSKNSSDAIRSRLKSIKNIDDLTFADIFRAVNDTHMPPKAEDTLDVLLSALATVRRSDAIVCTMRLRTLGSPFEKIADEQSKFETIARCIYNSYQTPTATQLYDKLVQLLSE